MSTLPANAGITRREALRWLALVASTLGMGQPFASATQVHSRAAPARGYGSDPDLLKPPAQPWPLTLTEKQRATAVAVLDVILPGEGAAPAASALGLVDFLDEWISAPYPAQQKDAALLIPLLDGLEHEVNVATAVADESWQHRDAFRRLCVLAAAAYYTTPVGMQDIGFVGNEPRTRFDGPPDAVLSRFAAALDALPANAAPRSTTG